MKKNTFSPLSARGWPLLMLILGLGISASAAVDYVDLHPTGADRSEGYGVSASNQVGAAWFVNPVAALWSGSSNSFVSLNPTGAVASFCCGVGGGQQVGFAVVKAANGRLCGHAALWTGTAESFRDLHPTWAGGPRAAGESWAWHTTGAQQSGKVRLEPGYSHAILWSGSPEESVDLSPRFDMNSDAMFMSGGRQGGWISDRDFLHHAAMWSGTPQSLVDLHPAGFSGSMIRAITDDLQAGCVIINERWTPPLPGEPASCNFHAAVWRGTSESLVDLHPAHASGNSEIFGACGPYQVGLAVIGGQAHAALWSGTAESFVDLHAALGANYLSSHARAVWTDGIVTHVVGSATENEHGVSHAMLWTITGLEMPEFVGLVRLKAVRMGDRLLVTWPSTSATGFVLEQTSNLSSARWETVSIPPAVMDGEWGVSVPLIEHSCYFRLRKQ